MLLVGEIAVVVEDDIVVVDFVVAVLGAAVGENFAVDRNFIVVI